MKTIKKTLRRFVNAALLFLIAVVLAPASGVQAQDVDENTDAVDQQRPMRRGINAEMRQQRALKTLDQMPDNASRFTLNSGKEMYFLEGELYTFAERESTFVAVPTNRLAARGPSGRGTAVRGQAGARQAKGAQWNNGPRSGPVNRKAVMNKANMNKANRQKATKRDAQWHRQHNRRFHQG